MSNRNNKISWLNDFEDKFFSHNKDNIDIKQLKNKYIMFYFSASWCPPCVNFTNTLIKWYNFYCNERKDFEIILVTLDENRNDFINYYKKMPWLAVKFNEKNTIHTIRKLYKNEVKPIPSITIIDCNGRIVTEHAREKLVHQPGNFPWGNPHEIKDSSDDSEEEIEVIEHEINIFKQIMTGDILGKRNTKCNFKSLSNIKRLGLYFSASWCPPCRNFTPRLKEWYNNKKSNNEDSIEIIFISLDNDRNSFNEYYEKMPWLSIPFGDSRKTVLEEKFNIESIPTLIFINYDGSNIDIDGCRKI